MKKTRNRLFAGGLSAFMLMNALPLQTAQTAFAAEIEAASRGDLNGDGITDSVDLDALKSLIGKRPDTILVETDEVLPYDITQDGFVDARDTYALSQYLSGAAKELPVKPGKKTDARIGMNLTGATCFPGDEVRLTLSFVEWTKDIAAYEITLGFDTGLKLKDVQFFSDDCQYVPAARTVKLTGLHKIDALHRGDFAVLTFTTDKTLDGKFPVAVEAANVFTSEYNIYQPVKPETTVEVYPLYEPVALEASGIGSKSVSLKWDMPFTDQPVVGYRVYRGKDMIKETEDTSFLDTGLTVDTDYIYTVSAVTESGAETAQSQPVQVHTAGPKILSADFPAETVSDANSDLTVRLEQAAPLKSLTLTGKSADGKTVTESADLQGADLSTFMHHWKVSELPDGAYTFHITVTDTDGASASSEVSVKVEKSPLKPVTLKGEAGGGTAVLTWSLAAEAAVTGYTVYRLKDDGKTWEKLAEIPKRDALSYTDTKLTAGKKYTYAVRSKDNLGQDSPDSNTVTVTPEADTVPPEITLFKPAGGQFVSGAVTVSVRAEDSSGVAYVGCEISADDGKTWKAIGKTEGGAGSWQLNTADYKDGTYKLRALAEDTLKNVSDGKNTAELAFDNTAPAQVQNIRAVQVNGSAATLAWDAVADADFSYFAVIVSGGVQKTEYTVKDTLGINLNDLTPKTTYAVTVYAVDAAGNAGAASEPFRFVTTNDTEPPVISVISAKPSVASAKVPLTVTVSAEDISQVSAVYLEYSQDQKNWKQLSAANTKQAVFSLSDSSLKEGKLYFRAYAKDQNGNTGDPKTAKIYEIDVDNTAPPAPKNVAASVQPAVNVITWQSGDNTEPVTYRVECGKSKTDTAFRLLADRISVSRFEDKEVAPNHTYCYRITAIDTAGNLSTPVYTDELKRTPDTEKPVIRTCSISQNEIVCSAHHTLQILASDNIRVASVSAAYRCKETDEWKSLKTEQVKVNTAGTELLVRAVLPEEVLLASGVNIMVTAADAAGNKAEREFGFQVDDKLAEIKNFAVKPENNQVTVSWTCPDASGVSAFYVYRKTGSQGSEYCVGRVDPQKDGTEYVCIDDKLYDGGDLIYRIEAVMDNGNSVSVTLDPIRTEARPQAVLYYTPSQVLGAEYSYDATDSMKASDITKLVIDFGDGERAEKGSVESAVFTHKYLKTGTYTVTLTVSNKSGMTGTETGTVTVAEPSVAGKVRVKVTKTDGLPAANITVYSDIGTDQQVRYRTDTNGTALIPCTAGMHEFGVFDKGYLPVRKICTVTPDSVTELPFTVQPEQLVKADFTVNRMSLAEIQAAGIDVKDPENCNLVKIDVSLSYQITSTVTDHITIYYDADGKKAVAPPVYSGHGGGSGRGTGTGTDENVSDYHYQIKEISKDVETLVLMRVPANVQFLKEFFKVDMIVLNNASKEFSLTNSVASLNLPEGLSLVEHTPVSQPRTVSLGTIEGGSQSQVSWIVRGDRSGDYDISADFTAELQPFKEHVSMHFQSDKKISVNGNEAASVQINFDPVIRKKNLIAEIVVENNTSSDMNKVDASFGDVLSQAAGEADVKSELYQTRIIDTNGAALIVDSPEKVPVLHPGQKLSFVYKIVNVLSESIDGIYKKTESEIKATANSKNVRVAVKHVKIEDEDNILYGIAFDQKKDFLFLIRNKNREPIANAKFEMYQQNNEGKAVMTPCISDEKGRVIVPRGESGQDYRILVTPDSEQYLIYDDKNFRFSQSLVKYSETILLDGNYDADDYTVNHARYSDSENQVNLLTQQHTISVFDEGKFSITGTSANPGSAYELWQEGRKEPVKVTESTGNTFAFTDLKPSSFIADRPVFIRVKTTTGDPVDTRIGLNFINLNPDDPLSNEMVKQASDAIVESVQTQDWCFTIPLDWMPECLKEAISDFVMDCSGKMALLPDGVLPEGKAGLENDDGGEGYYFKRNPDKNTFEVGSNAFFKKKFKWGMGGSNVPEGSFTFAVKYSVVFDTLLLQVKSVKITGNPELSFKAKLNPTPILLPLGATLNLFAEGKASLEVIYEPEFSFDDQSNLCVTLPDPKYGWKASLGARAEAGWQVGEALKAIVYGSLGFLFTKNEKEIESITKLYPFDKVELDGKLGIEVTALDFAKMDLTLLQGKAMLWEKNPVNSGARGLPPMYLVGMQTEDGKPVEDVMNDVSAYQTYTADMIPQAGAWNAQLGEGLTELQSGISNGSVPAIVSDGTNTLMVWIVKDIARGVENAPYAVWSRYDSSTKTWSEPKAVDDNGNADSSPMLLAGKDGIRLAYLESGKVYADGETPELGELFSGFVFKTAKFDAEAGGFTDFRTAEINKDGGVACKPKLAQAADGTTYLVWQSNANGDIFGNDSSNRILCAKETADGWDTPVVLAENLPMICSMTSGQNTAGEPVLAYTCAEAAEDGTAEAGLYLTSLSGETLKLAAGQIDAPQFAKIPGRDVSGLVWYQDGSLYASEDLTKAEVICSSEDCFISNRFAIAGDRILFLSNVSDASALFSTQYDAETKKFTAPVCIEAGENLYYESLSLADVSGETLYAMARTTVENSGEHPAYATSLTGGVLCETEDIRLAEAAFSVSSLEAGQKFPIRTQISNDGTVPVESLTLRILDEAGNEVAADTKAAKIISGNTETVTFEPMLPKLPAATVYTIAVSTSGSDRTPDNNAAELDLTKTDIAVSTDLTYIGDKTLVTIYATNRSLVPASASIRIRPEQAEEDTLTLYTNEIAPQTTVLWQLDAEDMLGGIYRDLVHITAKTDIEDAAPESNSDYVLISDSGMDPFKIGDINLDGKVDLEDAMLALNSYTRIITELPDTGLTYSQEQSADVDQNGSIDLMDAMTILEYYAGCVAETAPADFREFLDKKQNGGANHEAE